MMITRNTVAAWILALCCFGLLKLSDSQVPQQEVDALQQIATEMGATQWRFNGDSCEVEMVGISSTPPTGAEGYVECNCNYNNDSVCHVTKMYGVVPLSFLYFCMAAVCIVAAQNFLIDLVSVVKSYNLPGVLPVNIVKLPYLQEIDFAYNLLSGTIPLEWASTQLNYVSVLVNRLSGEIPNELGNITSLTYLNLEANNFSGPIPSDIGKLINLKTLILSSNQLTGQLPTSFSALKNLNDFRINDNNLSGRIPDFIQNWKQLNRSEMQASGLEGPIPVNISLLNKLTDLVLRNCNISGAIPAYIWRLRVLQLLDVSFNKLVGQIPNDIARNLKILFVTGNMLSGNIPDTIFKDGSNIDISYNNFTWRGPDERACQIIVALLILKSASYSYTLNEHLMLTALMLNLQQTTNPSVFQECSLSKMARLSPVSLTYFHYCLENGSYNVSLHFAEILFTNDKTYNSLGRRMFDIYIQENLVWKDFNIEEKARGTGRPVIEYFNATVQDGTLEIRFYWASKGTTRIPNRGDYGSLVSAISVNPRYFLDFQNFPVSISWFSFHQLVLEVNFSLKPVDNRNVTFSIYISDKISGFVRMEQEECNCLYSRCSSSRLCYFLDIGHPLVERSFKRQKTSRKS
ncbi:putative LRR receptor-like serine/threonine-protein kinase RFK1 [Sesamum angolense]|uniref:non-specific serine/threonine protein kinase n=1 Tax=Sesamum angolense TaxID=2727404 RepID=A0AAE2BIF1_9LAMI|nr:putative LRR receptor-like serine/threonine-protein kinase RFK1 [Sesamum angolense]